MHRRSSPHFEHCLRPDDLDMRAVCSPVKLAPDCVPDALVAVTPLLTATICLLVFHELSNSGLKCSSCGSWGGADSAMKGYANGSGIIFSDQSYNRNCDRCSVVRTHWEVACYRMLEINPDPSSWNLFYIIRFCGKKKSGIRFVGKGE